MPTAGTLAMSVAYSPTKPGSMPVVMSSSAAQSRASTMAIASKMTARLIFNTSGLSLRGEPVLEALPVLLQPFDTQADALQRLLDGARCGRSRMSLEELLHFLRPLDLGEAAGDGDQVHDGEAAAAVAAVELVPVRFYELPGEVPSGAGAGDGWP